MKTSDWRFCFFLLYHVTLIESIEVKFYRRKQNDNKPNFLARSLIAQFWHLRQSGLLWQQQRFNQSTIFLGVSSFLVNKNYVEPENIYEEVRENVYDTPSSFQPLSQMELATLGDFLDANFINFAQQHQPAQ